MQTAMWMIGEYGDLILLPYDDSPSVQRLHGKAAPKHFDAAAPAHVLDVLEETSKGAHVTTETKELLLTALLKLSDRFDDDMLPRIVSMLDYFAKARHLLGFAPAGEDGVAADGEPAGAAAGCAAEAQVADGAGAAPNNERLVALARSAVKRAGARGVTVGTAESLTGGMIAAALDGTLTIDKLEAMTCVCSVGLDMIAVPGSTTAETISAIIADEAAVGMVNSKTTAVRIIPVEGADVGDTVEMGGLLGSAPLMPVHEASSADFIARGGRIPAPLQSLKN